LFRPFPLGTFVPHDERKESLVAYRVGLLHELLEVFVLHLIGWKIWMGKASQIGIEQLLVFFLFVQAIGAVLIYLEAKRE